MNIEFLLQTNLFNGSTLDEAESMLKCMDTFTRTYKRGEFIYHIGEQISNIGLILSGSVNIENDDIWGNKNIIDNVPSGEIFGETYAFNLSTPILVNVIALENSEILFINVKRLLTTCPNSCEHHKKIINNLFKISIQKNISLSRKIFNITPKTIRGRLLSYLSQQAIQNKNNKFTIPFNRQQLADYLNVERSALSNELSKMKTDGLIDFNKNSFSILTSKNDI